MKIHSVYNNSKKKKSTLRLKTIIAISFVATIFGYDDTSFFLFNRESIDYDFFPLITVQEKVFTVPYLFSVRNSLYVLHRAFLGVSSCFLPYSGC